MKKLLLISGLSAVAMLSACNKEEKVVEVQAPTLETEVQKVSYIVGYSIAANMKSDDFKVDTEAFLLGMNESLGDVDNRFTDEQARKIMMEFQQSAQKLRQEKAEKESAVNIEAGRVFLEENAKKEGVVQTESGLQYKELVAGDGPIPKADDVVVVHYSGTLIDGTEFDSSYKKGQPIEFPVSNLIPGWVEALQLMNVGDKWELYIPSNLGYGPGSVGDIPANSTLLFTMELLEIKEPAPAESAPAE